jgi:hypothetical protein
MGYQVFLSFKNTENNEFTADKKISEELYKYFVEAEKMLR